MSSVNVLINRACLGTVVLSSSRSSQRASFRMSRIQERPSSTFQLELWLLVSPPQSSSIFDRLPHALGLLYKYQEYLPWFRAKRSAPSAFSLLLCGHDLELSTTFFLGHIGYSRPLLRNFRPATTSVTGALSIHRTANAHHGCNACRRFYDALISEFAATDKFFTETAAVKGLRARIDTI